MSASETFNYSVIIPHKNCIDLLARCIASIPERDDLEIIVIDDNSGIPEEDFPFRDRPHLRYIFLDASDSNYAGHARNAGLKVAKGRWMLFADADDYYTESLNGLLENFKNDDKYDIVYLGAIVEDEFQNSKEYYMNLYIRDYLANKRYSEMLMRYALWTPWTRMVKRNMLTRHNIEFEECKTGNDVRFGLEVSRYAASITCWQEPVYSYYRPTFGSITDKYDDFGNLETIMLRRLRTNAFYSSVGYRYKLPMLWLCKTPSTITKDRKKQYLAHFWKLFRKHRVNIFVELRNAVVWKVASMLNIIKVG